MKETKPDIIANVYLYPDKTKNPCSEAKSMSKSVLSKQFDCPVFFGEKSLGGFDCRLLLDQINKTVSFGERAEDVPIKFLSYDLVKPHLVVGKRFKMWAGRIIGKGRLYGYYNFFVEPLESANIGV
jgi:hypothetical protein